MGLFINQSEHQGVFQHKEEIEDISNQSYFKTDYFAEIIQAQKNFNESLTKEVKDIKRRHQQNEFTGFRKWKELSSRLEHLYNKTANHDKFELEVRKWLQVLDEKNQEIIRLVQDEKDVKQEYIEDKLNQVSQSNQEIISQLSDYKSSSEQLSSQINEMHMLHQQMAEQISKQDEKQDKVLDSFENQEALLEKTFRQLDNLRSILFERTYHIVEKIENSWKPLNFMIPGKNKESKEKANK
ncbi:hypothetical protein [Gracilibacillus thailandensis]|uniref:t-SNARE coiled-coil homology domain-containing protein n=1 Tax=Gracilibacillus thailandensis TaxID=563735 RepID=A0A6N7R607_9BACI|nr:hypothetical protein [Gracilibacillus thailandensis]MRI68679.1 hypothetical protein [Gracilibacillus thailandensis]